MAIFNVGGIVVAEIARDIVRVDYGTAIVTTERVQDVLYKIGEIWGQRRVTVLVRAASLVDLAGVASVLEDRAQANFTVASAIVSTSKVAGLLANLYMRLQRSPYPVRHFTDEQKAMAWLKIHLVADEKCVMAED